MVNSVLPVWAARLLISAGSFSVLLTIEISSFNLRILRAIAIVGVLALVLSLDNSFRNNVYGRSDPLSFSLLGYSFLLVVSDSLVSILRSIDPGPPLDINVPPRLIVAALIYVILLFVVFFRVLRAHQTFQKAQVRSVQSYIRQLRTNTPGVDDAVWQALEQLGAETIEPDVFVNKFVNKQAKEDRRKEYLQLVKSLTNANITLPDDQSKLLVNEPGLRRSARFWYIVTAFFGVISALYFFFVR